MPIYAGDIPDTGKGMILVDGKEHKMNTSELIGKEVLDKSGNNVGKVSDLSIDFPQWIINGLIVKVGIIKKIPIGIEKIDKTGDKIILKITKDELGKT
jgi:sporulation protein YlmC with PRC-barrel domain